MRKLNFFRSFFLAATLITSSVAFTSCDDENDVEPVIENEVRGPYDQEGVFIINEGNWGTPNGSISFLSDSAGHQVQNGIFSNANAGRPLGDVIQDMELYDSLAYIVANNSNKIEVVNAYTFESVGVVENLQLPRHFVALNNEKGYVTETVDYAGSQGRVSVIDLNNYTVTETIEVGMEPEQLLVAGGKLYVANSGDNNVTVINTATDAVESTITVSDAPTELALDRDNNIWVLSAGRITYNDDWTAIDYDQTTAGALSKITPGTQNVQTYTFGSNQSQPGNLTINGNGDKLYFNYDGGTYVQDVSATSLSNTVIIDHSFYGLGVDPDNGYIYGGDSNGFAGEGTVHVYQPDGTKVTEFRAGIGPNGFVFN
ncbi:YncE family protein [Pontibacter diazotrophicus]|uniref:YncE family protein n=1 Tax=Pontibacter diazotrophicus TaxID=1400979 RepID=A0A3D8LE48_9BACT|nr:YncE family protein [Pontibacter diazotrophicus]RDV15678.1 YncE family protein [Pontibacter diazotrophicus]